MSWESTKIISAKTHSKTAVSLHFLQRQYDSMDDSSQEPFHKQVYSIENNLFTSADALILFNDSQKDFLLDNYKVNANKIYVIPQGVKISSYTYNDLWKKRQETDEIRVVFVGRLAEDKGIRQLIDVMHELHRNHKNVKLDIIGKGDLESEILTQKHPFITLHGYLKRPELEAVLIQGDVFCLPSKSETFGLAIVEAMQMGLPIVMNSGNYLPGLIVNGQEGFRIPLKHDSSNYTIDMDELEKMLETLVTDPQIRYNLGKNAYHRARLDYSKERFVRDTFDLYEKLCKNQKLT